MRHAVLMLLLLALVPASAETFHKRVLPDGSVEFSDDPSPGSVPIEVPEVQSFEAQPLPRTPPPSPPSATAPRSIAPAYQSVLITQPTEEQTLFFDAAGVGVTVGVQPGLKQGDRVVVYVDGQPVAAGPSTSLTIPTPPRGTHRITAEVQDSAGQVVLRTPPVTFHVIQHSRLNR